MNLEKKSLLINNVKVMITRKSFFKFFNFFEIRIIVLLKNIDLKIINNFDFSRSKNNNVANFLFNIIQISKYTLNNEDILNKYKIKRKSNIKVNNNQVPKNKKIIKIKKLWKYFFLKMVEVVLMSFLNVIIKRFLIIIKKENNQFKTKIKFYKINLFTKYNSEGEGKMIIKSPLVSVKFLSQNKYKSFIILKNFEFNYINNLSFFNKVGFKKSCVNLTCDFLKSNIDDLFIYEIMKLNFTVLLVKQIKKFYKIFNEDLNEDNFNKANLKNIDFSLDSSSIPLIPSKISIIIKNIEINLLNRNNNYFNRYFSNFWKNGVCNLKINCKNISITVEPYLEELLDKPKLFRLFAKINFKDLKVFNLSNILDIHSLNIEFSETLTKNKIYLCSGVKLNINIDFDNFKIKFDESLILLIFLFVNLGSTFFTYNLKSYNYIFEKLIKKYRDILIKNLEGKNIENLYELMFKMIKKKYYNKPIIRTHNKFNYWAKQLNENISVHINNLIFEFDNNETYILNLKDLSVEVLLNTPYDHLKSLKFNFKSLNILKKLHNKVIFDLNEFEIYEGIDKQIFNNFNINSIVLDTNIEEIENIFILLFTIYNLINNFIKPSKDFPVIEKNYYSNTSSLFYLINKELIRDFKIDLLDIQIKFENDDYIIIRTDHITKSKLTNLTKEIPNYYFKELVFLYKNNTMTTEIIKFINFNMYKILKIDEYFN